MIMPRAASQLLLPANPFFIGFTLIVALALDMLPVGRAPAMPDFLAIVLVFWNVHQPRRVGVGWAFFFGLLVDVHHGALLGQHALAYTLLSYGAVALHRRLPWFTASVQAVHVLPLFLLAHAASVLVRLMMGGMLPGWPLMLAPLFEAALWPVVSWVLLAPQRRTPDRDEHRPL